LKKAGIYFIISALLGLGIGYLVFDVIMGKDTPAEVTADSNEQQDEATNSSETSKDADKAAPAKTASAETEIFSQKGCLGCHSISALDLNGGATGPDLSKAFENVEGKHGKPINEFLKEPTSAVMSGVIGGNPLTDEEINKIVTMLEQAAQK
jgi:cytochrome c551/c552